MAPNTSTRAPKLLSAQRIADAKPGARDVWLSDDHGMRGTGRLLLRISRSGTRRFLFRYTKDGVRRTIPLGPYSHSSKEGHLTLKQAREVALHQATLYLTRSGSATGDPVSEAKNKDVPTGPSLLALCRSYAEDLRRRQRSSADNIAAEIERHIAPSKLAQVPARDVTAELVAAFLRELLDRGIETTAKRIRSVMYTAYEFALNAGLNPGVPANFPASSVTSNPVRNISSLSQYSQLGKGHSP